MYSMSCKSEGADRLSHTQTGILKTQPHNVAVELLIRVMVELLQIKKTFLPISL